MWSVVLSFFVSFCEQGNSTIAITDVDQTWYAWARGDSLEVINFWWWSSPGYGFKITFTFLYHCGIGDFKRLLWFLIQSPANFYDTWQNDSRRQENESIMKAFRQTSGSWSGLARKFGFEFRIRLWPWRSLRSLNARFIFVNFVWRRHIVSRLVDCERFGKLCDVVTERGRHWGVSGDAHPGQLGDAAADSHETPAGEEASRRETEAEAAREESPASAAAAAKHTWRQT